MEFSLNNRSILFVCKQLHVHIYVLIFCGSYSSVLSNHLTFNSKVNLVFKISVVFYLKCFTSEVEAFNTTFNYIYTKMFASFVLVNSFYAKINLISTRIYVLTL